jgi:acetyl-CoA C-acetyltransferase
VNKVCGSGMQTVIMGAEALGSGAIDLVVAGGMESMTNAPYLLKKHRSGARFGHDTVYDHMALDGLEDAYENAAMGAFAQVTANAYELTREGMDDYTIESLSRAKAAIADGAFAEEITPVTIKTRAGEVVVDTDEQPGKGRPDKIPAAPGLCQGRHDHGGFLLVDLGRRRRRGPHPRQRGRGQGPDARGKTGCNRRPCAGAARLHHGPVGAVKTLLAKTGWSIEEVDLFEVNEAFACVAMFAMHDLGIPHDKINVNGGATALGHPIGASGARIITTLLGALRKRGLKKGIATLCIGGGEATAVAVELI